MGFSSAAAKMSRVSKAAFGESITYTPAADSTKAFTCSARIIRQQLTQIHGFGYADQTMIKIRHADFAVAGITAPVAGAGSVAGDTITSTGPNDESELWTVTAANFNRATGGWELTVEKNLRFRP